MKSGSDVQAYFEHHFLRDSSRAGVWREIARFVQRDILDRSSLLELGCGYGDFVRHIQAEHKFALDLNVEVGRRLSHDVSFVQGDCTDLSFLGDDEIATVFASNLFEHIERDVLERVFGEIRRVLRPDGRFILIQPNYRLCSRNYFDDYTHVTVFSDVSMRGFLESRGFTVVKCIPGLLPLTMKSKAPKHPLLVRLYLASWVRPFARQMYIVAEKQT